MVVWDFPEVGFWELTPGSRLSCILWKGKKKTLALLGFNSSIFCFVLRNPNPSGSFPGFSLNSGLIFVIFKIFPCGIPVPGEEAPADEGTFPPEPGEAGIQPGRAPAAGCGKFHAAIPAEKENQPVKTHPGNLLPFLASWHSQIRALCPFPDSRHPSAS